MANIAAQDQKADHCAVKKSARLSEARGQVQANNRLRKGATTRSMTLAITPEGKKNHDFMLLETTIWDRLDSPVVTWIPGVIWPSTRSGQTISTRRSLPVQTTKFLLVPFFNEPIDCVSEG